VHSPKDTFVMELHVSKGTAPVYLMSKNKPTAYMRRSGSIYQMSMEMILQRMNFTMGSSGSVFQPLQSTRLRMIAFHLINWRPLG
jgi:hypothetical protein